MKSIGFYGHSSCAYRSSDSFLDILAERLKYKIVNTGTRQGSEERILYELKKTKNLDLAVIFHSDPTYLFLPGTDRDIGITSMTQNRTEYMFNKWDQFAELYNKKFINKFESADNFWKCFEIYKKYFYDPDLQMNRFYGALMQIDSYLILKEIPCIHVLYTDLPNWFKFKSGVVDREISEITKNYAQQPGTFFVNCISKEGNLLVANRLVELASSLRLVA